jgi:UDPglucose--hexose-1-phosphate uridylyltransferase
MELSLDLPHRRLNPLTADWVLVSPQRTKRPWQGQVEKLPQEKRPAYDPNCYLCPGNGRAGGAQNPNYQNTFVFTNDFAALLSDTPRIEIKDQPLIQAETVRGTCRVICYSPRHDLSMAEMTSTAIHQVVDLWAEQTLELGKRYKWVQVFENKGAIMGCSNPHPHGQIWAGDVIPNEPAKEDREQQTYFSTHGRWLLGDYLALELAEQERTVDANEDWLAVVPYWAVWPFEILLIPRRQVLRVPDLDKAERATLAQILKQILVRYDNLFETSFPYSMGWHGAPCDDQDRSHWRLHAHFYPPLLRSATIKKFLVGYEMLAEAQRDITPERAAEQLRSAAQRHYLTP